MSFTKINHYEKEYADTHHDTALNVTEGVEDQPIVSPYFTRRKKRRLSTDEYVEGILAGNITTLSQAITLVESNNPAHYAQAQQIIERCLPHAGKSVRIGITKADGENIHKAELAKTQFQGALRLFPVPESGWRPNVYTCSAVAATGLEEVWKGVEEFLDHIQANGYFRHNRNRQNKYWMYESINEVLRNSFYHDPAVETRIAEYEKRVLEDKISSFIAAKELLDIYFKDLK